MNGLPLLRHLDFAEAWETLSPSAKLAVKRIAHALETDKLSDSRNCLGSEDPEVIDELKSTIGLLDPHVSEAVKGVCHER